jgi:hypothetical protein
MPWLPFNLNNCVRVKLTDEGRAYVAAKDAMFRASHGVLLVRPVESADGWSEWQMWELMQTFGDDIFMGGPHYLDMNVLIDVGYAPAAS